MQLTEDLRTAIDTVAASHIGQEGKGIAQDLSANYRSRLRHPDMAMAETVHQAAVYAATRMPATWAATGACMREVNLSLPGWSPESLLDVGAGTGAALWAAASQWPSLRHALLIERAPGMMEIGRSLCECSDRDCVRNASWISSDVRTSVMSGELIQVDQVIPAGAADLVTATYMINEVGEENLNNLADWLWKNTGCLLIVAEPGTPDGWKRMMRVRERLLMQGAYIVSPCPHHDPCPVQSPDWCHFTERVNRTRMHRQLKEATLAHEDEKFSYTVFSKMPASSGHARILRHPRIQPGRIDLTLCTVEGLCETTITKRMKEKWRAARNASAGDTWIYPAP